MEIVKKNFIDKLPDIARDIESCCFIAFDGEFTGLASERNIMPFDTSQEYYEKQLKTSEGFILIQLGISMFKIQKDSEGAEHLKVSSYNIYVYPQSKNAVFKCQGSSLSFLAANNFDFNKLFSSGISFCDAEREEKIRKEVKEKQDLRMEQLKQRMSSEEQDTSNRNFIPVPELEKELIKNAQEKIQDVLEGKVPETMFEKLNPFQRKLIYELIEREFNNKVSASVKTVENKKILVVTSKISEEEELKMEENRQKEDELYIANEVGLRLLMKMISASKKLIVGHNCLLDLMYLITQCFEQLPEDYNKFKTLTHRIFPNIIDTKFIGGSEKFKEMFPSTVLNQLYQQLTMPPFEKVQVEFENRYNSYDLLYPKEHEAGYDSFLTGYCFLVILKYLKVPLSDKFEPQKCKELNPYLNRIAVQRIQNPFIYITGNEPIFSRYHVFFVKFPPTWQSSDVQDHFKNYGPVQISWVDSTSAFISLYHRENASCVLKTIPRPAGFEIQPLAEYQLAVYNSSRKRKKEDSESSDSLSGKESKAGESKKSRKRGGKKRKAFTECDQW